MPKRTNEFQQLIALIEKLLADGSAKVTESKELRDNIIDKLREVDIVIERSDGIRDIIISVECTGGNSTRRATVEWVERMWGKHQSLPTNKLILVSKSGFTASAKKKAEWWYIDAIDIDEAKTLNWNSVVKNINEINISNFLIPYITEIKVIFEGEATEKIDISELNLPKSTLCDPQGEDVGNPFDVATKWLINPEFIKTLEQVAYTDANTVIEFERRLEKGCYLVDGNGKNWPVIALQVKAQCKKELSTISLEQGVYGKVQIAHGKGSSFGRGTQVLFAQRRDESAQVAISIKKNGGSD